MIKVKGPSGVELPIGDADMKKLERASQLARAYEITMETPDRAVSKGLDIMIAAMKGQPRAASEADRKAIENAPAGQIVPIERTGTLEFIDPAPGAVVLGVRELATGEVRNIEVPLANIPEPRAD